jgi:hypothetical protein
MGIEYAATKPKNSCIELLNKPGKLSSAFGQGAQSYATNKCAVSNEVLKMRAVKN